MCGCRKTAIIGGILNALGWILSAYASNVHYLFLTFGVAAGKSGTRVENFFQLFLISLKLTWMSKEGS